MGRIRKYAPPARGLREEDVQAWNEWQPILLGVARWQREHGAVSARNFCVGCAALVRFRSGYVWPRSGANYKSHRERRRPGMDYCAEMAALELAKIDRALHIIGFVVIAPYQRDDVNDKGLSVTAPCYHCRVALRRELQKPHSPVRPDTRILCIDADNPSNRRSWLLDEYLAIFHDDPPYIVP